MANFRISKHAREQMEERGISEDMVNEIMENPDQTIAEDEDKLIYQSIREFNSEQKSYLVRIFINILKIPWLIITVYKTSKIKKYWKDED